MQIDAKAINKHCSNLRELYIYDVNIDCEEAKPIFARVTVLSVRFCQFIGNKLDLFSSCSKVQKLAFSTGTRLHLMNGGFWLYVSQFERNSFSQYGLFSK